MKYSPCNQRVTFAVRLNSKVRRYFPASLSLVTHTLMATTSWVEIDISMKQGLMLPIRGK